MKRSLLLAVLVCGCGSQFTGTYTGMLSKELDCSGDKRSDISKVSMTLKQTGDQVEISSSNCPGLGGTVAGDVVELGQFVCPTRTVDGVGITETITGGKLTLAAPSLSVDVRSNAVLTSGGESVQCSAVQKGALMKEGE